MLDEIVNRQVLALASQGASAAEIAGSLELEEAAVRLILAAHEKGSEEDRDINDEQLGALRRHAYNLAVGANDESVQARMTMYLIDRDKPKERTGGSPIVAINQALVMANDSFRKLMEDYK